MISTITILNTSRSGPGQAPTLVGYSSVLPNISKARRFKSESQSPSQRLAGPLYRPVFQCLLCVGDIT